MPQHSRILSTWDFFKKNFAGEFAEKRDDTIKTHIYRISDTLILLQNGSIIAINTSTWYVSLPFTIFVRGKCIFRSSSLILACPSITTIEINCELHNNRMSKITNVNKKRCHVKLPVSSFGTARTSPTTTTWCKLFGALAQNTSFASCWRIFCQSSSLKMF